MTNRRPPTPPCVRFRTRRFGKMLLAETLGVSRTYAYEVIKSLNKELRKEGYLTISGKVEGSYFLRRYFPSFEATPNIDKAQGGK